MNPNATRQGSSQTATGPSAAQHPAWSDTVPSRLGPSTDTGPQPLLPGPGLPHDRHVRIAARRTFVAMKQRFMAAVAELDCARGDWLRFQVRQAQDPVDLWLLRGVVFDALGREGPSTQRTRLELTRELDSVFPNNGDLLPFGVRP